MHSAGDQFFEDADGVSVYSRWWPVAAPRGVVLVSHGASEHCARYDRFAAALNDAGFAAAAVDHRGHGRTAPSSGAGVMGPGGGISVVNDLHQLRTAAAATFGVETPMLLFGHSMGSLIALAYLTRHSAALAGAVLCGFPTDPNDTSAVAELLAGAVAGGMRDQAVADLADTSALGPQRTRYDWLSRDDAEVDRYIADPMCGDDNPLTYGYLADLFDVVAPAGEHLDAISCPLLVIAGDKDPAGGMGAHPAALAEALRAAGRSVDLTIYPDARHELLNETNRDDVTADIIRWLDARTG
jgi:alpha-beta hydrolase superfamily lysophospholipase